MNFRHKKTKASAKTISKVTPNKEGKRKKKKSTSTRRVKLTQIHHKPNACNVYIYANIIAKGFYQKKRKT